MNWKSVMGEGFPRWLELEPDDGSEVN